MDQGSAGVDPGPGWQWRFWSIFAGQSLSLIGSAMTQFVLIWWITDTTGDLGVLATAGLAALLPQALLGPVGGTFADRYSRRMLMIVSDLISALCIVILIALFLSGHIALWHIYMAMFVRSAATAFQLPAAAASEAMLVPQHFLPRAAGLNQALMGIVTVAAAPLGALAIAVMPVGMALWIDVGTALLGITPLLIFTIPQHCTSDGTTGLLAEFREGTLTRHLRRATVRRAVFGGDEKRAGADYAVSLPIIFTEPLHTFPPKSIHFGYWLGSRRHAARPRRCDVPSSRR